MSRYLLSLSQFYFGMALKQQQWLEIQTNRSLFLIIYKFNKLEIHKNAIRIRIIAYLKKKSS